MSYDFNNKSAHKKRIFVAPIGRSCQPSHTNIQAIAHCFELQPKDARKRLSLRRLSLSSLLTVVPRVNADPRTSNSKAVPAINRSSKLGACRNRRRCVDDMILLIVCAGGYDKPPLTSFGIPPLVIGFLVARREN